MKNDSLFWKYCLYSCSQWCVGLHEQNVKKLSAIELLCFKQNLFQTQVYVQSLEVCHSPAGWSTMDPTTLVIRWPTPVMMEPEERSHVKVTEPGQWNQLVQVRFPWGIKPLLWGATQWRIQVLVGSQSAMIFCGCVVTLYWFITTKNLLLDKYVSNSSWPELDHLSVQTSCSSRYTTNNSRPKHHVHCPNNFRKHRNRKRFVFGTTQNQTVCQICTWTCLIFCCVQFFSITEFPFSTYFTLWQILFVQCTFISFCCFAFLPLYLKSWNSAVHCLFVFWSLCQIWLLFGLELEWVFLYSLSLQLLWWLSSVFNARKGMWTFYHAHKKLLFLTCTFGHIFHAIEFLNKTFQEESSKFNRKY